MIVVPKVITKPKCHPDRKHHAKGLCRNCYITAWAKRYGYMYQRIWQAKHPERQLETKRRYTQRNKGKLKRKRFLYYWTKQKKVKC